MILLKILLICVVIQGVPSRSIQNVTSDDIKVVTVDMLEGWKKNISELMTGIVDKKMQDAKKHVFFYARMATSDIELNKNSILKFGTVLYNKGDNFYPGDSIFIAPVSGMYMFTWTMLGYNSKSMNTELRVNNVVKEILNANMGSSAGYLPFTRTVICEVTKGNHVWIQTGSHHSENYFDVLYSSKCSFMGILMYET